MMNGKTAVGKKRVPGDAVLRRCGLKRLMSVVLGLCVPERWAVSEMSSDRNQPHNGWCTIIEGQVLDGEVRGRSEAQRKVARAKVRPAHSGGFTWIILSGSRTSGTEHRANENECLP